MRHKAYTAAGLKRVCCVKCGAKASEQWSIKACAMKRVLVWRPLCAECDIQLNELVLEFLAIPNFQEAIAEYRKQQSIEGM